MNLCLSLTCKSRLLSVCLWVSREGGDLGRWLSDWQLSVSHLVIILPLLCNALFITSFAEAKFHIRIFLLFPMHFCPFLNTPGPITHTQSLLSPIICLISVSLHFIKAYSYISHTQTYTLQHCMQPVEHCYLCTYFEVRLTISCMQSAPLSDKIKYVGVLTTVLHISGYICGLNTNDYKILF